MMNTKEMVAVILAFDEGKTIQGAPCNSSDWMDLRDPCWNFDIWDFRVKPAEPRVFYVVDYFTGCLGEKRYLYEFDARKNISDNPRDKIVKFVEEIV
jgi:hypothetical protein|tara:strand:+ start:4279 stop:4569 length:291 start_codon:yes stop_codon:yes gene_type:complete